ncbi:sigma 54-interacting transcriptional regulator [Dyadobacter subterraneus]|uniref:Sigma 54-interacting transcriptional regulator n=1 Tax=Dyadobacter subterraneus TaxID=2773304 RepID=A0ABR9WCX4_9BACT|nr:sigma 54-interacting response regulator [Dyadobacter subterraneus]MBE9463270.1 sigma 54-interacting transcriptional regulator [Dyadobacter subterraneus]
MNDKVLIVEDEFIVANDLRVILKQAGYRVSGIAASVEEAEEMLQKNKPDLVLVDIRLDGKQSGIDFAKKLKAENIAFVYISANSSQEILEEAKATDPYGFIVKPFREKDLLVTIDIALYRHKHSLESKFRLEELLQKQLSEITANTLDNQERLLRIARALQVHIPFDLIACSPRPLNVAEFEDKAYLRVGFDEYQFIGKKELMTIANLKETGFSQIIENSGFERETIYFGEILSEKSDIISLQKLLSDSFRLRSLLVFPVEISTGNFVDYFFYSRQQNIYTKSHAELLKRLKTYLGEVSSKKIDENRPATLTIAKPRTENNKLGDAVFVPGFKGIVGSHPLLLSALDQTMQVAPYNTSVLILGESGTGKENVAQSIHALSTRKNGPFVKVNCAAIPALLIESELFGHEKGSFTGATEKRKGKFEQAEGGTIFLDEIGELPLDMQVKLLRVLQEKEIEYVGSSATKKVNVRIIAATNRNLEKEVAHGTFRLDLYYRLNVFPITLPPLRERKSDIEALTLFFADKFCKEFGKIFYGVAESMLEEMQAYDWPGNVRELVNVLEQSVILNDGKSKLQLKRSLRFAEAELSGKTSITTLEDVKHIQRETERDYIISILKKANGVVRGARGAAELLNIKPTTLESKMAKLGIRKDDFINQSANE